MSDYRIRSMNIWKEKDSRNNWTENRSVTLHGNGSDVLRVFMDQGFCETDVSALNLSVRSYNCLKRAGCNTVGDILELPGEEGPELMRIRNLGIKSAKEILEKLEELHEQLMRENRDRSSGKKREKVLVKPSIKLMDVRLENFRLPKPLFRELSVCGVSCIRDLYEKDLVREPGWYVVRQLYDWILEK